MSDALNLNPENFMEGGGLIDDVDVTFVEARFEEFDYNGKTDAVPALKLLIDAAGEEVTQFYSMGRMQDWKPSKDGKQLLKVGTATSIRLTSNGGILLKSLVDAGFPADKLGDDISVLDGCQCHMIQVPEPSRGGLKKTKEQEEKEKKYGPKTILVVSEVQTLPWEKSAPAGKGKKAAGKKKAAKKAAPKDETGDLDGKATEWVMALLAENETLTKKELPQLIFKHDDYRDDDDKNAIIKLVFSDDFLNAGPWEFEDGTLSMG